MAAQQSYKIALIGDSRVGKTTLVRKLRTGHFEVKHVPTLGVEVHPVRIDNHPTLNIWDCAGDYKFRGLSDGYYIQGKGAIVMCDPRRETISNIKDWVRDYKRVAKGPIVVAINKKDIEDEKLSQIEGDGIFHISCKTGEGISEMLIYLYNKLASQQN